MSLVTLSSKIQSTESVKIAFQTVLNNSEIGFTKIPERQHLLQQSEKLAHNLTQTFSQFVVVGIGGSSAGPRALVELSFSENIFFLDNVDSVEFEHICHKITKASQDTTTAEQLKKTAIIFISKSGSTIEVLWNYSALNSLYKKYGLELIDYSFFITEPVQNDLSQLALEHKRPVLEIPVDVGGRFSVLTPVGLLIAQLCGFSLEKLYVGAAQALKENSAVEQACTLFLESFKRNENITLFWFYNSNFRWFGNWLQQLWAESLGKKLNRRGEAAPPFSTPIVAIGSCDQHSILQQVAHGTDKNRLVCFYHFESVGASKLQINWPPFEQLKFMEGRYYGELIQSQAFATEEALRNNQVSTARFLINDQQKSECLGFLFMYFQLIVATLGEHENINAFDQPGVALGKDLTLKLLKKQ